MILTTHEDALHRIAEALMEKESLDADAVIEILSDVPKWEHTSNGSIRLKAPDSLSSVQGGLAAHTDNGS
jgi:hypothetical protein